MNTSEAQQKSTKICEKHKTPLTITIVKGVNGLPDMAFESCDSCEDEFEKEQIEKINTAQAELEYQRLIKGIPKLFTSARLTDFQNIDPVLKWIDNPKGFLFIHGGCGCGKSRLSSAIKYHFNSERKQCLFAFCSDIFLNLRKSFNSHNSEDQSEYDIINRYAPDQDKCSGHRAIFDDIGAQKISDYVIEAWYNIIDRRYMFEHPTIFTSNLSLSEISAYMTDRIASRLASGVVFKMNGIDRRIEKNT